MYLRYWETEFELIRAAKGAFEAIASIRKETSSSCWRSSGCFTQKGLPSRERAEKLKETKKEDEEPAQASARGAKVQDRPSKIRKDLQSLRKMLS